MDGESGSAIGDRSRDVISVAIPRLAQAPPFPILTTIEPLFKRVREDEGPSNEPPQFALATNANVTNKL